MDRWAIIVCGSREWTDSEAVDRVLSEYYAVDTIERFIVIHGDARGADSMADWWCLDLDETAIPMPAQWSRDSDAAGPKRNAEMLKVLLALRECGYRVRVEAFSLPQSRGTKHMKRIAEEAGVEVREHGVVE